MNVAACGYYASARFERRDKARDGAVSRGGRQRNDGYASGGKEGAADEIHLPANAGVYSEADRVCANLPRQVHFNGGIDRDDAIVAAYVRGIVGTVARVEFNERVVVNVVVQTA